MKTLLNKLKVYLNKEHQYPAEKLNGNQLIAAALFAYPLLGFLYLKLYYDEFNMDYFNHFDLGDSIYIMYKMAIPLIFVLLLLSLVFCYVIYLGITIKYQSTKKIKLIGILVVANIIFGSVLYVFFDVKRIPANSLFVFITLSTIVNYLYLSLSKKSIYLYYIIIGFMLIVMASNDAKNAKHYVAQTEIVLKNKETVLSDGDISRRFAGCTTKYLFIWDIKKQKCYRYALDDVSIMQ